MKEMVIYSHKLHGSQPWVHIRVTGEFKKFNAQGFILCQFICPALNPVSTIYLILVPSIWGWICQLKSSQTTCVWEAGSPTKIA